LWHGQALASTLNEEELADLKDQFDAIDIDKSGSISIEEMRHVGLLVFVDENALDPELL
jgi:Ca2+-binding EF-hand superfamily protein